MITVGRAHMFWHMCEGLRTTLDSVFLFYFFCGFWGLNSGHQTCMASISTCWAFSPALWLSLYQTFPPGRRICQWMPGNEAHQTWDRKAEIRKTSGAWCDCSSVSGVPPAPVPTCHIRLFLPLCSFGYRSKHTHLLHHGHYWETENKTQCWMRFSTSLWSMLNRTELPTRFCSDRV